MFAEFLLLFFNLSLLHSCVGLTISTEELIIDNTCFDNYQ